MKKGFTIVGLIVAFAMLSLLGMAFVQFISWTTSSQRSIELKAELEGVRKNVRESVDCDATLKKLAGTTCNPENNIDVFKTDGTKLSDKNDIGGTVLGSWALRGRCVPPTATSSGYVLIETKGRISVHDPGLLRYKEFSPLFGAESTTFCSTFLPKSGSKTPDLISCSPKAIDCEEKNMHIAGVVAGQFQFSVENVGQSTYIGSRIITAGGDTEEVKLSADLGARGLYHETQIQATVYDDTGNVVYNNPRALFLQARNDTDSHVLNGKVSGSFVFPSLVRRKYAITFIIAAYDESGGAGAVSSVNNLSYEIYHLALGQ